MAFSNPNDGTEILYGASGDVRDEINAYVNPTTAGHYSDETELPGRLIINALRRATRFINGYLETVYADQIPFTSAGDVPKLLDEIGSDIATFYCFRSISSKAGQTNEEIKRDYFDIYANEDDGILPQLRDREIQLSELTGSFAEDAKGAGSISRPPIFDVDSTLNHEVDQERLNDIAEERGN